MEDCFPDLKLTIIFVLLLVWSQSFDINHFVYSALRYLQSFVKGKLHVLDTAELNSICLTTDVDYFFFHMNNARYLRELDFARIDFYLRTNITSAIRDHGGEAFQGATSVRYRRFIKLFDSYKYTTRIVYWDESSIYTEHRFITTGDNFVRAIVYGQLKVVNCNVNEVMEKVLAKSPKNGHPKPCQKPECPEEISLWIKSMNASSKKLRQNS